MMNVKTVILARGGSKGIPNKNIIDINGKPLLQYTIESAKKSDANDVWVSTDCPNIMRVAINSKANVLMRPSNISGDKSKSEEALLHFADTIKFDILVFIQPTSPLLSHEDINVGIQLMKSGHYDSLFSAYKEHWIPRWNNDITPDNWDIYSRPMRQDVKDRWVENGAVYFTTKKQLETSKLRYGGRIGVLEMPPNRSFQIDTFADLEVVKKILR